MAPALMRNTASVLVLFLLAQVPASNCAHKCRKLKSSIAVDWSKLEKKLWIQALVDKPHGVTQCIARSYRGNQGKLYLRAVGGSDSQLWNITKEYSNGLHDKDTIRFPKLWPPHFYQILDTDYETYLRRNNRRRRGVIRSYTPRCTASTSSGNNVQTPRHEISLNAHCNFGASAAPA
ncbi:hypothetical protein MTO96_026518 [Rhipicephalus appendiculatus]